MQRIANKNARKCVEQKTPFKGSNMYGVCKSVLNSELFVVYSYGEHFPMFIAEWEKGADPDTALWYENADKFYMGGTVSRSTERQRSYARPFGIDYQFSRLTTEAMCVMADYGIAGVAALMREAA